MYAPPPAHYAQHPQAHPDERHHYDPHAQQQYAQPYGAYVPYPLPGTILSAPQGGGGGAGAAVQVIHTDDAATKLSDRVRRRCFNCCTTDTSTWRRSNLSPGKVLCNKCGLFERTHSRPRPEQFPHKRGPLASSTLRSRSPPPAQAQVRRLPIPIFWRFPFWDNALDPCSFLSFLVLEPIALYLMPYLSPRPSPSLPPLDFSRIFLCAAARVSTILT
ncbi:hypothetical protein C8R47DRAFT_969627 [Mycena vitilis]|nr:hypothetical protein C8R47DRAFT_969627 [Mycena vitilis]